MVPKLVRKLVGSVKRKQKPSPSRSCSPSSSSASPEARSAMQHQHQNQQLSSARYTPHANAGEEEDQWESGSVSTGPWSNNSTPSNQHHHQPSSSSSSNPEAEEESNAGPPFRPLSRKPVSASLRTSSPARLTFDAPHLCLAGGAAIFHLATERVVLVYHARDRYYFLPKGRRDANEQSSGGGACREGFEESGFRCRLLPVCLPHVQPLQASAAGCGGGGHHRNADGGEEEEEGEEERRRRKSRMERSRSKFNTEPVLTQLEPISRRRQYLLHWYVAETLSAAEEAFVERAVAEERGKKGKESEEEEEEPGSSSCYVPPRPFPGDLTLRQRVEEDRLCGDRDGGELGGAKGAGEEKKGSKGSGKKSKWYEPVRHQGTGVDEEEAWYVGSLVPVADAVERLRGTGQDWVVKLGWEGIVNRWRVEEEEEAKEAARSVGASASVGTVSSS